jgi:hypothetical protein
MMPSLDRAAACDCRAEKTPIRYFYYRRILRLCKLFFLVGVRLPTSGINYALAVFSQTKAGKV